MMNTRKVYTEGKLAEKYYSVRECGSGFELIEGTRPSSYSSRYEDKGNSCMVVFMVILLFAMYVVAVGLKLL